MSYDLMVFDKTKAPKTKNEFMGWFRDLTEWEKEIDYDNPTNASTPLQNWYHEMIKIFPPMNGSFTPSVEEIDNNKELEIHLTDYSIDTDAIYACFAWSLADKAYDTVYKLAVKHGVGFFNPSSGNGEIVIPDDLFEK